MTTYGNWQPNPWTTATTATSFGVPSGTTNACPFTWWWHARVYRRIRTAARYWRAVLRTRDERYIDAIVCAARGRHRIDAQRLVCGDCALTADLLDRPL